ncbi:MAG: TetR/AcrR family transcriptional regulator [Myxococcota bacterium]|nr:TetR/AcrR family transcriptional regulator [Myxococcales bacterium]
MSVTSEIESTSRSAPRTAPTRERLRASGVALFATRGLHSVTTHDIAHDAGLAAGTFYLHYKDKQALFTEIVLDALDALRTRVAEAVRDVPDPALAVERHATALVDFAADNRDLIRVLFSGEHEAAALEHDVLETLAEAIAKGRSAGGRVPRGVDPRVLAQAVVGMYARVVAWWAADPSRATREDLVASLTRIQLHGTQPD